MISRTSDTAMSDPTELNSWQERRQDLGEWAWNRLAVKRDRHGTYSTDGKAKWSSSEVTQQALTKHFAGAMTLGLGVTSSDDQCLWVAWDLDNHGSDQATNRNLDYAIVLMNRLVEMGFRPIVEDSDGKGGIHVWTLFVSSIPAAIAYKFAAWMVRDCAQHGLNKIESFPKSPTVLHTVAKCGNYLRVPGKHHKRDHWSRFWGDGEWLSAEASVQLILDHAGDDPALIPEMPAEERQHNGRMPASYGSDCDCDLIVDALNAIPNNDLHYDDWLKIGMALHACDETLLDEFQRWSATSQKHDAGTTEQKWRSFSSSGKVQPGTIFHIAKEHGWTRPCRATAPAHALEEAADDAAEPAAGRSYNQTDRNDIGNSKHFANMYRDELRYCAPWKKWHCWDGCRWKIDDEERPLRLAKELTTRMFGDAMKSVSDNDGVGVVLKHACSTAKLDRLKAMITLAGPELPIRVSELDTNPSILNCPNGMVDLKAGELLPHDRRLSITKLCPTEFQPGAESELWNQFLRDVFVDDELIKFIQRLFGYFLTGDVSEQKLPIFFGTGANGKSTLLNAFMETLGLDYTMQCMPDFLMKKKWEGHPTENARLFGQRFVSCVETDASCDLAESKVKMLTGGERINARRMHEDFWQFNPTHKMVLCTNHRPVIKGTDDGIWRRVLLIPFLEHFNESRQDKQLPEKLKAERVAILAWAVQGCLEWQRMGLQPPKQVCEATAEYKKSEDLIGRFLEHRCILVPAHSIKFSELYTALESFGRDSGDIVPDRRTVGIRFAERGLEKFTSNGTWYRGLLLRSSESTVEDLERTE